MEHFITAKVTIKKETTEESIEEILEIEKDESVDNYLERINKKLSKTFDKTDKYCADCDEELRNKIYGIMMFTTSEKIYSGRHICDNCADKILKKNENKIV